MKSVNSLHHIVTTSNNLVLVKFFLQAILLFFPTRYIMVQTETMGSIPPRAVDLHSIEDSTVCLVLFTTPLNSLSLAALTDPPDQANIYQGHTTSI